MTVTTEAEATEVSQQDEAARAAEAAEAEKAFGAGYNKVRGDEPPTEKEPAETEVATETRATETPETPVEEPLIAGMKESEVRAALEKVQGVDARVEKEVRAIFGKLGEFNRTLEQLRQTATTPAGVRFKADAMKRLKDDYPDIYEALAADLPAAFEPVQEEKPKPSEAPADIEARVTERVQAVLNEQLPEIRSSYDQRLAQELLTLKHPTWMQDRETPEFKQWRATLPKQEAEEFDNSWDWRAVSGKLDQFKAWKDDQARSRTSKTRRLETALTPKGTSVTGPSTINDEEGFSRGFNKVAKARTS